MYVTDTSDKVKVWFIGSLRTTYSPLLTHTLVPLIYSIVYVQHTNETGSYHLVGCDLVRFILLKRFHCEACVKLRVQVIETPLLINQLVKKVFCQSEHQSTHLIRERWRTHTSNKPCKEVVSASLRSLLWGEASRQEKVVLVTYCLECFFWVITTVTISFTVIPLI